MTILPTRRTTLLKLITTDSIPLSRSKPGIIHIIELLNYAAHVAESGIVLDEFAEDLLGNLGVLFDFLDLALELNEAIDAIREADGDHGEIFAQIYGFSIELCFAFLKYSSGHFLVAAAVEAGHTFWSITIKEPAMDEIRILYNNIFDRDIDASALGDESAILAEIGIGSASSSSSDYRGIYLGGRDLNSFDGGQGGDLVFGGPGNDHISGQGGNDQLNGGAGLDTADVTLGDETRVVRFEFVEAASASGYTLVDGTHVRDTERVYLSTGSGNDKAWVGDLTDHYWDAGAGVDRLTADLSGESAHIGVSVNINGSGTLGPNGTGFGFHRVEALTVTTGSGNDQLHGAGLIDILAANAGNDMLWGNGGNDVLDGGADDDTLYGSDGDDALEGGRGSDVLSGGSGDDRFLFEHRDSAASPQRADLITDFSQAEGDRINLRGLDADESLAGIQRFDFIGSATFSGVVGELRYKVRDGQTFVEGDTDGDGVKNFTISLTGEIALVRADFLI